MNLTWHKQTILFSRKDCPIVQIVRFLDGCDASRRTFPDERGTAHRWRTTTFTSNQMPSGAAQSFARFVLRKSSARSTERPSEIRTSVTMLTLTVPASIF